MLTYHFISEKYGMDAVLNSSLKVARINALNDPFEFLHMSTDHYAANKVLKDRRNMLHRRLGILCFSSSYFSPVQWAHYADIHRGLCLCFDIPDKCLLKIKYLDERSSTSSFFNALDMTQGDFARHMLTHKYAHWSYEEEVRMLVNIPKNNKYDELVFRDFDEKLALKEVIIGYRSSLHPKHLRSFFKKEGVLVSVSKVKPSKEEFRMEKTTFQRDA